jgi:hypothetical protein
VCKGMCRKRAFCSPQCQVDAWPYHKTCCQKI